MKLPFVLRDRNAQANFDALAGMLGNWVYKGAFSFATGWANYGGFEGATYSRIGRLVVLQGLITKTGGVPTAGDLIGTLPAGFRPSAGLLFVVATGEAAAAGRVDIGSAGQITWQAGATGGTDYTSLSGISFVAA